MSRIGRHSMPSASRSTIERGDALVLRLPLDGGGVGAHEEEAPLGDVGRGDPDLLAVEDVVVAVPHGEGAQVGEVAAGLGLGEALAPVVVGVEDVGHPALLLLLGAPADDHGPDLPEPVGVVDAGRAGPGHLLGVDDVLGHGGVAAAPLGGPVDGRPPPLVEGALPRPAALHRPHDPARLRGASALAVGVGPLGQELRQVVVEPRPELVPEGGILGRLGEVHEADTNVRYRWSSPSTPTRRRCATPSAGS